MRLGRMQCCSKFLQSQAQCQALPESISNKKSMSFKCVKIAFLQELQQKNNSTTGRSRVNSAGKAQKCRVSGDTWRDLPGCCLHQTGSWGTKSLSAHCYSETRNRKPQTSTKQQSSEEESSFLLYPNRTSCWWAQRDNRNATEVGISVCQLRLSMCKSHEAEGISAWCWGAAWPAQPPKCLPGFLNTLSFGKMSLHIPRLSPKPGIWCCASQAPWPLMGMVTKATPTLRGERRNHEFRKM